ncbi:MAG: protein kinase domain-containing protein [Dermatophilaceae bacterium]
MISTLGRYQVEQLLGVGSFAAVYLAHDPALDGPVALKVLADHFSTVPEVRERFVHEARLLRRLGGEAGSAGRLVTVHDIAEESGQPYLVMEYLARGSLQERLASHHALASVASSRADDLYRLSDELESCLSIIHAQRVTHRDIKPSNLLIRSTRTPDDSSHPLVRGELLDQDEVLVLADFGVARGTDQTNLTLPAGTPGFSPPEQLSPSVSVDSRADLYAATAVVVAAAVGRPASWPELRGQVTDPEARTSLARCLADIPDDRPPDAASWREEMSRAVPALMLAWVIAPSGPVISPTTVPPTARRWPTTGFGWSRRWLAGGALIAALLGSAATLALQPDEATPAPTPTPTLTGPQIIGPETLLVGERGVYRHQGRPGVTYRWTGPDGKGTDAPSLTVVPTAPADLTVTLTETDGDQRRTSRVTIRVRTQ